MRGLRPFFYRVTLILWHGTEHARRETLPGSLFARKEPSERTIREHVRRAYRHHALPIRILEVSK